ncbi:WXG100-like domain-containing protein [Streptomyces sp. WG-D5]
MNIDIKLPNELDWLLDILGFQWPNIDIDTMMEAAQEWTEFGSTVQQFAQDGNAAAAAVTSMNSGDAVDAFIEEWGKFGDGGTGVGYLDLLHEASIVLAGLLEICAVIIAAMKIAIIVQLIDLAIEFAVAQASAVVTLGASEAGLAARIVMIRAVVKQIITQAVQKIGQAVRKAVGEYAVKKAADVGKELAMETAKSIGMAVGTQVTRLSLGAGVDANALVGGAINPALKTFTGTKWGDEDGDGKYGLEADGVGKVVTGTIQAGQGIAEGDGKKAWEGYQDAVRGARDGIGSRYEEPGKPTAATEEPAPEPSGQPASGDGGEPASGGGGETTSGGGGEPASGGGGEPASRGAGEPTSGSAGESRAEPTSGGRPASEGSSRGGSATTSERALSDGAEDDGVRAAFG